MYVIVTHLYNENNVNSFQRHNTHRAALISVTLALSQTPVYTTKPRILVYCIAQCACLRPSFRWYSLRIPTEGWPGWVDLGGWLHTPMVSCLQCGSTADP